MKKLFLSLLFAMFAVMPILADNDAVITKEELPEKSQIFLTRHFDAIDILYVKAEREMGVVTSYDVTLEGNVKVEFNRSGEWLSVDCEHGQVPESIIPRPILEYVTRRFSKAYVAEIERNLFGYEVKLNNDLELDFDKNGEFVRVD